MVYYVVILHVTSYSITFSLFVFLLLQAMIVPTLVQCPPPPQPKFKVKNTTAFHYFQGKERRGTRITKIVQNVEREELDSHIPRDLMRDFRPLWKNEFTYL